MLGTAINAWVSFALANAKRKIEMPRYVRFKL